MGRFYVTDMRLAAVLVLAFVASGCSTTTDAPTQIRAASSSSAVGSLGMLTPGSWRITDNGVANGHCIEVLPAGRDPIITASYTDRGAAPRRVGLDLIVNTGTQPGNPGQRLTPDLFSGFVWDWQEGAPLGADGPVVAAGQTRTFTLAWPRVDQHGTPVHPGVYHLTLALTLDGSPDGFFSADFRVS